MIENRTQELCKGQTTYWKQKKHTQFGIIFENGILSWTHTADCVWVHTYAAIGNDLWLCHAMRKPFDCRRDSGGKCDAMPQIKPTRTQFCYALLLWAQNALDFYDRYHFVCIRPCIIFRQLTTKKFVFSCGNERSCGRVACGNSLDFVVRLWRGINNVIACHA